MNQPIVYCSRTPYSISNVQHIVTYHCSIDRALSDYLLQSLILVSSRFLNFSEVPSSFKRCLEAIGAKKKKKTRNPFFY